MSLIIEVKFLHFSFIRQTIEIHLEHVKGKYVKAYKNNVEKLWVKIV